MNLTRHSALICGLIAAFIFAQTPDAYAKAAQPQPQQSTQTTCESRPVKTIVIQLNPDSDKTPQQVADDLKLLSPDEISLLAANPNMMSVGGHRGGGYYEVDETGVIVLAAIAVILVIIIVAIVVD